MKKTITFQYLRLVPLILLPPLIYFALTWGDLESKTNLKAPIGISITRLGYPVPDIRVSADRTLIGKEFQLSSLKGYPVIIHFWATWCAPCIKELPELIKIAEIWRLKGYSFVAIAEDDSWATVEQFLTKSNLPGFRDHMVMILDPDSKVAARFGTQRYPESYLINDKQIIDNKLMGAQAWLDPGMEKILAGLRTSN